MNGILPPLCDTVTLLLPVRSFTVSAGEFPAVSQAVMEHAGRNDCAAAGKEAGAPRRFGESVHMSCYLLGLRMFLTVGLFILL